MKSKIYPNRSEVINATRIEVHHSLADKFASQYPNSTEIGKASTQKATFNPDLFFSVLHRN